MSILAEIGENDVKVGHPKNSVAGVPAVAVAMKRSVDAMGVVRTARSLPRLNQVDEATTVHCWAMGITQHRNAVATIKELTVNVATKLNRSHVRCGRVSLVLLLQGLRSHDQFNTTIYGAQRPLPGRLRRPAGDLPAR